jgi:hypothetical protein
MWDFPGNIETEKRKIVVLKEIGGLKTSVSHENDFGGNGNHKQK